MRGKHWFGLLAVLVLALAPVGPIAAQDGGSGDGEEAEEPAAQELPDWVKRVKISGLAFGDYYWYTAYSNPELEGFNGFWLRRAYLTFDVNLAEEWDFRLRFEANSPGNVLNAPFRIEPFVKDMWARWSTGNHQLYFGLSPSPTWARLESFWGFRDVVKTPLDLQRMGGSRDFGVAAKGSFDDDGLFQYHVMVANGAGTRGETNKGKAGYASFAVYPGGGFVAEVIGEYNNLNDEERNADFWTLQAWAGWQAEGGRVAVHYAHQDRNRLLEEENVKLNVLSFFGVWNASDRVALLGRYDRMFDPNPLAGLISYIPMDPTAKSNYVIAGLDWAIVDMFHVIPNLQWIFYQAVDDEPAPDATFVTRVTFSVKF